MFSAHINSEQHLARLSIRLGFWDASIKLATSSLISSTSLFSFTCSSSWTITISNNPELNPMLFFLLYLHPFPGEAHPFLLFQYYQYPDCLEMYVFRPDASSELCADISSADMTFPLGYTQNYSVVPHLNPILEDFSGKWYHNLCNYA